MKTLTETINRYRADWHAYSAAWDAAEAAGADRHLLSLKSDAQDALRVWERAAEDKDEALLALELAIEEADVGNPEIASGLVSAGLKWLKRQGKGGEKDGQVFHAFSDVAAPDHSGVSAMLGLVEAASAAWVTSAKDGDLGAGPEADDYQAAVTAFLAYPCRSHDDVRMKVGLLLNDGNEFGKTIRLCNLVDDEDVVSFLTSLTGGGQAIEGQQTSSAEPICDRVGRLSHQLADALNDYQGGQFYAVVWPSASTPTPAVLFGSRSSRFVPEILDRMSAA